MTPSSSSNAAAELGRSEKVFAEKSSPDLLPGSFSLRAAVAVSQQQRCINHMGVLPPLHDRPRGGCQCAALVEGAIKMLPELRCLFSLEKGTEENWGGNCSDAACACERAGA